MKKLLSIFITAAIACTLTACGNDGEGQVSEETVAVAEMKTIEPPEDGWTLEELFDVTYLYGHQLKKTCTLDTLGNKFSFNLSTFSYSDENNSAAIILQYENSDISAVELKNCMDISEINNNTELMGIFLTDFYETNINNVTINGITFFNSKDEVIKCLGEPDISEIFAESSYILYNKSDTNEKLLSIGFNDKNEVINFHITF